MIRAAAIVLASAAVVAAEPPEVAVSVQEVAYAQRIEFVLGNDQHPFADEDQRRAQVVLQARVRGKGVLLGWSGLSLRAQAEGGEALAVGGAQAEGVFPGGRELRDDPAAQIAGVSLPLTRQALRGLSRLEGGVDVILSREPAARVELPLATMQVNVDTPLPAVPGAVIAVSERSANRIAFRMNRAAYLVLQDAVFAGPDGKDLPTRNRKAEWRDEQGQLSYNLKTDRIASAGVLLFRTTEVRHVDVVCADLALGLTLPGRDDLRGTTVPGAGEF